MLMIIIRTNTEFALYIQGATVVSTTNTASFVSEVRMEYLSKQ